jgi:hypothetical protein
MSVQDVSWEAPALFRDDSNVIVVAPAAAHEADGPRMRVGYESLAAGETIRTLADRRLAAPTKALPDLEVLDLEPTEARHIGGREAIQLRLLLQAAPRPLVRPRERLLVQTIVWVDDAAGPDPGALCFEALSPLADAPATQARLEAALASVRFEVVPSAPPSRPSANGGPWNMPDLPMPGRR